MTTVAATKMTTVNFQLKIDHQTFEGESIAVCVAAFIAWRDLTKADASKIGAMWSITKDGINVGDVSFNGRYWSIGEYAARETKRATADKNWSAKFINRPRRAALAKGQA